MCNENESRIRKNDAHVRMFLMELREEFIRHMWKDQVKDINELQATILDTMKVLCLVNE